MRKRVPKARHRKGTFVALLRKLLLLLMQHNYVDRSAHI